MSQPSQLLASRYRRCTKDTRLLRRHFTHVVCSTRLEFFLLECRDSQTADTDTTPPFEV